MKKDYISFYFTAALLLSSCAHSAFEPVRLSSVEHLDFTTVRQNFQNNLAVDFTISELGVLKYRRHQFPVLAYTNIQTKENTLAVTGLTPLGTKVFDLKAVNGEVKEYSFSMPQIKKKADPEKMAQAMTEDMWHVYFDRVPAPNADKWKTKNKIYYKQAWGSGTLEFIFGGLDARLIEKRYYENNRLLWDVRYFEYQESGSKLYASKTFYRNRVHGYSIALKLKEILP